MKFYIYKVLGLICIAFGSYCFKTIPIPPKDLWDRWYGIANSIICGIGFIILGIILLFDIDI